MKTCARCGRVYPPDQVLCPQCGLSLPGMRGLAGAVSGPDDPNVGHIDFLLGQLDEWVKQRWVAPEQARRLYDIYQERRRSLIEPAPSAVPFPSAPKVQAPRPEVPIVPAPTPVPPRRSPLAAFFEESNLSLWQLVGALLLLAGLVGLVRWTWDSVGRYLVLALMLGLTCGLFALARSSALRQQPLTRSVLVAVSALLVPLDMVAVNAFRLLGGTLEPTIIGLLTSAVCLPLYVWLVRREPGRWPAGALGADTAAALYFLLQILLPPLSASSEVRGLVYGAAFALLALGFLLAANRADTARREVYRGTAHVAALSALALALWLGGPGALGAASAALLLLGLTYAVAAALFDTPAFVLVSQAALVLGGASALHRLGFDDWYVYAAWVQAVGLASWLSGRGAGREMLARAWTDGVLALTGLSLIGQATRAAVALSSFPALTLSPQDVGGLLLPAALSFGSILLLRRLTLAAGLAAYLFVLLGLLTSRLSPVHSFWHTQPNLGLLLAGAALGVAGWGKRPRAAWGVAALSLLFCTVYAALGAFWETTALALPLLAGVLVWRRLADDRTAAWPAAAALTLETLLLEVRGLPWAHAHWGWELNYGFGPALLCLAFLGASLRFRSRPWRDAGLALAAGDTLLQLGYAANGSFPCSPLGLLAFAALIAAGADRLRQTPKAAECAAGFAGGVVLAFLLGAAFGPAADANGRETLTALVLALLALLFAIMAWRPARPWLIYPAALASAVSLALALHRALHPALVIYALAEWPLATLLSAAALWPVRRRASAWRVPLLASALLVSLSVLPAALSGASGPAIGAVCLYGILWSVVGIALQAPSYTALAALTFSGAAWLAILRLAPSLSAPKQGFALGLVGLLWLALAAGAAYARQVRFAGRVLSYAAVGVGLAAALIGGVAVLDGRSAGDERFAVYTLLLTGTALLGASRGLGAPGWGHAGIAAYALAYFAFLSKRLGAPGPPNSDFYLIPVGLYVLALGLSARRGARPYPAAYFLAGLLLLMTPTFVAAWLPSALPLHAVLLLTECVGSLFYGIVARIKAFAGAGLAFLVALLLRETQGLAGHIHWAVYATLLGLGILGSALFLEKRGAEVRRWADVAKAKLQEWD